MYSINTQLTYFKYGPDSKRVLINITWYKLAGSTDLKIIEGLPFKDFEIEQFQEYMALNKSNFPGPFFIQQIKNTDEDIVVQNSVSTSRFPAWLILSKNKVEVTDTDAVYKIMLSCLTDESYQQEKVYDLNFDVLGKIQIYKEIKI